MINSRLMSNLFYRIIQILCFLRIVVRDFVVKIARSRDDVCICDPHLVEADPGFLSWPFVVC